MKRSVKLPIYLDYNATTPVAPKVAELDEVIHASEILIADWKRLAAIAANSRVKA